MESFASQRCKTLCWVAAGLLGLFVVYLLRHYWDVRFILALIFGLVAFFVLGWLIPIFACPMDEIEMPIRRMPAPVNMQPKPAADPTPAAPVGVPAASPAVSEKAAVPKAAAKKAKTSGTTSVTVKAAQPVAEAKVAKTKLAAVAPVAKPVKAKVTAPAKVAAVLAETVAKPSAKSAKPTGLAAARNGKADDLKVIVGVGPAMEKLLNNLGFYHFDQIAAWKAAEVAWVDDNLEGFKGRVTRDKWVAQAKKLAKG